MKKVVRFLCPVCRKLCGSFLEERKEIVSYVVVEEGDGIERKYRTVQHSEARMSVCPVCRQEFYGDAESYAIGIEGDTVYWYGSYWSKYDDELREIIKQKGLVLRS